MPQRRRRPGLRRPGRSREPVAVAPAAVSLADAAAAFGLAGAAAVGLAVAARHGAKPGYPSAPSARKSDEILPTAAELPEPGHARVEGDGDGSPDMEATKGDYAVPKLRQMRV